MNEKKILILVLITVLSAILLVGYHKIQQDDAYIYYTYAKNIASGNGYVFNIGERINATTSPLYTLLLAFVYFVTSKLIPAVDVPIIGELIGVTGLWLAAYALYKIFNFYKKDRIAILTPLVFLTNPLLRNSMGMEISLLIMFILWGIFYFSTDKRNISIIFFALAFLTRFDSALFLMILLIFDYYRNRKLPSIIEAGLFILMVLPWFIFSFLYFGSLLPDSILVKLSQSETGLFGSGLLFFNGIIYAFPGGIIISISFIILFLTSLIILFLKMRETLKLPAVLMLIIWSFFHFITYSFLLNTPPYPWYYSVYSVMLSIIISIFIDLAFKKFNLKNLEKYLLLVIFFVGLILPLKTYNSQYSPKFVTYKNTAEWLNNNAPDGSSVLIDEIGILGYYYNKGKINDSFGLINPEVTIHLKNKNENWAIKNYKPDYIIADYPNTHSYLNLNEAGLKENYRMELIIKRGVSVSIYKKIIDFE